MGKWCALFEKTNASWLPQNILIVVELDFDYNNPHDHFTHALLSVFLCSYCANSEAHISEQHTAKEIASQSPVYAVLTDTRDFYFLQYDGCNFVLYKDETRVYYPTICPQFSLLEYPEGVQACAKRRDELYPFLCPCCSKESYISGCGPLHNHGLPINSLTC